MRESLENTMKTSIEVPGALKKLSLIALAVALAGCSLSPRYERPQAPIAASYPTGSAYEQATPADADQVLAADIGWRDFFRDPLLQQLIALSLESNRDLQKAALNVEAARAMYRIQRADLLPSLDAAGGSVAERLPADISPTGTTQINRRYDVAGVATAWELDLWGRIRTSLGILSGSR